MHTASVERKLNLNVVLSMALVALVAMLLGCGVIEEVRDDEVNEAQMEALESILNQMASIAKVIDDPSSANNTDLQRMVTFDPFAVLVDPDVAASLPLTTDFTPLGLPPQCITANRDSVIGTDCQVTMQNGVVCNIEFRGSGGKPWRRFLSPMKARFPLWAKTVPREV